MAELTKYKCSCGSQKFRMMTMRETMVDFGMEGAIGGHPMLTMGGEQFMGFRCVKCGKPVPTYDAEIMRKEVI